MADCMVHGQSEPGACPQCQEEERKRRPAPRHLPGFSIEKWEEQYKKPQPPKKP